MTKLLALTRAVPESFGRCELVHVARQAIDVGRARAQHASYEAALQALGCEVRRLPVADDLPDSVFVEDTAVVLHDAAILTRPGAPSRRPEVASVAPALRELLPVEELESPGTLDGGDVLRVDRTLYVGASTRSDAAGIAALGRAAGPHGYEVATVPLSGCLHLKTAVTLVGERLLLLNPEWVDVRAFPGLDAVHVDAGEPFAANALALPGGVIHPAAFPGTRARLEAHGIRVVPVDVSEIAKAEGGVTCCSILVPSPS